MSRLTADEARLQQTIGRKAARRARSRRAGRHTIWFGIGMFGLVGWAVVVPTVAGIALGVWLDRQFPGGPSWALTGLVGGAILGSFNAWWWVKRTGIQTGRHPDEDLTAARLAGEAMPAASSGKGADMVQGADMQGADAMARDQAVGQGDAPVRADMMAQPGADGPGDRAARADATGHGDANGRPAGMNGEGR